MGAYASAIFAGSYGCWKTVAWSRSRGSPVTASTTRSFVILKSEFDGIKRKSLGFTTTTFSLYNALNRISKDLSVPLLR